MLPSLKQAGGSAPHHLRSPIETGYTNSGMIQLARLPEATRWILSNPVRKRAVQFSHVGPAECGESVTLGKAKSGWFGFCGCFADLSTAPPVVSHLGRPPLGG